jgi:hypothetical protein
MSRRKNIFGIILNHFNDEAFLLKATNNLVRDEVSNRRRAHKTLDNKQNASIRNSATHRSRPAVTANDRRLIQRQTFS